jgi:hypothetical protein
MKPAESPAPSCRATASAAPCSSRDRPHRLDDTGLSLSGRRRLQTFRHLYEASAIVLLSLNALMSALVCVLVFLIARISFGERAAKWSGWAWAFCPYAIYFPVERIWETWLATLLLCLLFLITLNLENENKFGLGVFGLLWGLAALTSPALLSVLPFLAGWVIYRRIAAANAGSPSMSLRRSHFWRSSHPGSSATTKSSIASFPSATTWDRSAPGHKRRRHRTGALTNSDRGIIQQEWNEFKQLGELGYMDKKKRQAIEFIRANPGWYAWTSVRRAIFCGPATGAWIAPISPRSRSIRRIFCSARRLPCWRCSAFGARCEPIFRHSALRARALFVPAHLLHHESGSLLSAPDRSVLCDSGGGRQWRCCRARQKERRPIWPPSEN